MSMNAIEQDIFLQALGISNCIAPKEVGSKLSWDIPGFFLEVDIENQAGNIAYVCHLSTTGKRNKMDVLWIPANKLDVAKVDFNAFIKALKKERHA